MAAFRFQIHINCPTLCIRSAHCSLPFGLLQQKMALSLSSSHVRAGLRPVSGQRQSVRPLPPPRAGLGDAFKDFLKIFSKPEVRRGWGFTPVLQLQIGVGALILTPRSCPGCCVGLQTSKDWQSTGNTGYPGKISHHDGGKPFKDGFVNKAGVAAAAAAQDAEVGAQIGLDRSRKPPCSRLPLVCPMHWLSGHMLQLLLAWAGACCVPLRTCDTTFCFF